MCVCVGRGGKKREAPAGLRRRGEGKRERKKREEKVGLSEGRSAGEVGLAKERKEVEVGFEKRRRRGGVCCCAEHWFGCWIPHRE